MPGYLCRSTRGGPPYLTQPCVTWSGMTCDTSSFLIRAVRVKYSVARTRNNLIRHCCWVEAATAEYLIELNLEDLKANGRCILSQEATGLWQQQKISLKTYLSAWSVGNFLWLSSFSTGKMIVKHVLLLLLVVGWTAAYVVQRNVKDYGAKGDGTTDDSNAIITALTQGRGDNPNSVYPNAQYSSSTQHPAYVFFPPGTYLVTQTLPVVYYTQMVWISSPNFLPFSVPSFNPSSFYSHVLLHNIISHDSFCLSY